MAFTQSIQSIYLSVPVMTIVGLCIGSFINVVAYRLPKMMEQEWEDELQQALDEKATPLAVPCVDGVARSHDRVSLAGRSRCPSCGNEIKWYFNVPVLGWFLTKGRCSRCNGPVSFRYPAVELVTGIVFGTCAWLLGPTFQGVAWAGFGAVMIALALIDADTFLLPDVLVMPLVWAGLLLSAFGVIALPLRESVVGAAVGYGALWFIAFVFRIVTGKDGMGRGDMKLLAACGAWMGWIMLPFIAVVAAAASLVVVLGSRLISKKGNGEAFPFGPYLVLGALACASQVIFTGRLIH